MHLQGAPKNPRAETARSRDTLSCACAMGGGGGGLPLPEPTVSVVDVDGQPTEVIETMSLVRSMPALDVVVFPGNPGSAQFYVRYMQVSTLLSGLTSSSNHGLPRPSARCAPRC